MGWVGCELLSTQILGPDIAFHWSESGGMRDRFDSNSPPMEYPNMAIKSVVTNYDTGA
jgi:hypothetical protein